MGSSPFKMVGDGSCFGRELSYVAFSREHCLLALLREKLSF